jgi:hypothetical protein
MNQRNNTCRPVRLASPATIGLAVALLALTAPAHANLRWDALVWDSGVWASDNPNDLDADGVLAAVPDNCPEVPNADQADLDTDGLGNVCDPDADGDGLDAAAELANGTQPLNPDTDDDELTDGAEVNTYGTDPLLADTDGDGNPDGAEVLSGRNPVVNEGAVVMTVLNSLLGE